MDRHKIIFDDLLKCYCPSILKIDNSQAEQNMSLDFLQVSQQVQQLGEKAVQHQHDLKTRLVETHQLLEACAQEVAESSTESAAGGA